MRIIRELGNMGIERVGAQKRELSIRAALEWAFGAERCSIDFDDFAEPAGCDTIWRLMQRGLVGCKVDGGGTSPRHDDAEVIASYVAALPAAMGGAGMAVQIASLARAGTVPDWMPDARPRCIPADTRMTKHGLFARISPASDVARRAEEQYGKGGFVEWVYRGRKQRHQVMCCPVVIHPSAAKIAAARRGYLDWWGALFELRHQITTTGLRTIKLTQDMPARQPWHTTA